ncbi:MAG: hypothetical protein KGZ83_11155 [Sulfuricella sp.]|nr:hypothetical protein [Sulfuricella sp.]
MTPIFTPTLYRLWCLAWRYVHNHERRLVDLLGRTSAEASGSYVATGKLETKLASLLNGAPQGNPDDFTLRSLYACLAALDAAHREVRQSRLCYAYPEVEIAGVRYTLLLPGRQSIRRAFPEARRFKLDDQIGLDGALGLGCRWVALQHEDRLDWGRLDALDGLHGQSGLRVGIAPCAASQDMRWQLDAADRRAPDGRSPLQCLGCRDEAALRQTVAAVLRAAYDANVHVLLFPELVLDSATLQAVRDWLAAHNLAVPRLRLVVAGSRHCPDGVEFSNRCTVLGLDGSILWEQDKRTPFVLDDAQALNAIQPGCTVTKAFEPTLPGYAVALRESLVGRLLTPICLDYINDPLWAELGADIFLVPAMTKGVSRFRDAAKRMGAKHGAASFVCNAATDGKDRLVDYLPGTHAPGAAPTPGGELFTIDFNFVCI